MNSEQKLGSNNKISSESVNMLIQYIMLGYSIDLHFHDYKLEIEIHKILGYKIKRQKAMEQKLGCKFIKNDTVILSKKTLIFLKLSMKYLDTSNDVLIN